jgi:hypothetical protein
MGTPGRNQTDHIILTCNGEEMGSVCDIAINVEVLTMGYQIDCDNIQIMGSYQTRHFMDSENFVKIPIEVLQTGTTSITTNIQNGLKFSATQSLSTFGPDTLILRAEGSPTQEGRFNFTFTTDGSIKATCSFTVDCSSKLGTFEEPACNCLAIYEERPFVPNGEYWLQDCKDDNFPATRTYCDIAGGGWTLVWSYSEKTAREVYVQSSVSGGTGNRNRMEVSGAFWSVFQDRPTNRITTSATNDGPTDYRIDYNNFRLNRNEWRNLPSSNRSQIKVRVAENPTNMHDEWALNNYGIISPRAVNENPIETNFNNWRARVPSEGKIFGKRWRIDPSISAGYGGWDEMSGNRGELVIYNSNSYSTHFNFGNNPWGTVSTTLFEVVPNLGGANNTIAMSHINNAFGWFGETEVNHHFGKCSSTTASDTDFSIATCSPANLYPHSFNNGEGRCMQWFVR